MEVNSAWMAHDWKDAETHLIVADLFKYSVVSICFPIYDRGQTELYSVSDKNAVVTFKYIIFCINVYALLTAHFGSALDMGESVCFIEWMLT